MECDLAMEKLVLLFSGQGAQYSKMGLDLYQIDSLFREKIDQASQASGLDIVEILANEEKQLDKTAYVQPALVAMSLGIYAMLERDYDLEIVGMVGLSLGEYGALMASGALDYKEGMKLLRDRGAYMQADADAYESMLAAVLGPNVSQVEEICQQISTDENPVGIANYNSPKQVVLGGSPKAVLKTIEELKTAGAAKKVVPLKVSGAFHTPLFKNTSQKLSERLKEVKFNEPKVTVMSNTTSEPFSKDQLVEILSKQVCVPTHFADCVSYLLTNKEVTGVLELGPGETLSKFVKQIDRKVKRYHIEDMATYQAFGEELRGN